MRICIVTRLDDVYCVQTYTGHNLCFSVYSTDIHDMTSILIESSPDLIQVMS